MGVIVANSPIILGDVLYAFEKSGYLRDSRKAAFFDLFYIQP